MSKKPKRPRYFFHCDPKILEEAKLWATMQNRTLDKFIEQSIKHGNGFAKRMASANAHKDLVADARGRAKPGEVIV